MTAAARLWCAGRMALCGQGWVATCRRRLFWHRHLRDGDVVMAEPRPVDDEICHVAADGSVTVGPVEPGFDPAAPTMEAEDAT